MKHRKRHTSREGPANQTGPRSGVGRAGRMSIIALVGILATSAVPNEIATGNDLALVDSPELSLFAERLDRIEEGLSRAERIYERDVRPIEQILTLHSEDDTLVRRIALALIREGDAVAIDPRVLTSVLLVENPWLNPSARSSVGAIGLMQVMPFHAGGWGCEGTDLTDLDANICHGARVFEHALAQTDGNVDRALLKYNGCVRGTNTPDCHLYPSKVYAEAGKAAVRRWMLPPPGT